MDKKKTPLQIESDKVQELVRITNNKILELGVYSQSLYDALLSLQALFDRIRNSLSGLKTSIIALVEQIQCQFIYTLVKLISRQT